MFLSMGVLKQCLESAIRLDLVSQLASTISNKVATKASLKATMGYMSTACKVVIATQNGVQGPMAMARG